MVQAATNLNKTLSKRKVKEALDFSLRDYKWPFFFLVSASLIGLNFPLGYIFMILVLVNTWRKDRYDFIIQITLFCGGYSLLLPYSDLFIPFDKIIFIFSIILMFLYRKNWFEKKIIIWFAAYAAYLLFFAFLSDESIKLQLTLLMNWLSIAFFIIPLAAFEKGEFDLKLFLKKIFPYLFIICIFYILDGIILCGAFFLPRDASALFFGVRTTFLNLNLQPFSFNFIRIWPPGLYISLFCVYALVRYYKMSVWQWIVFLLALFVCRTFTLYVALIFAWIISYPDMRKKVIVLVGALIAFIFLYSVDSEPVDTKDFGKQSALRVSSSVEQFTELFEAKDEEDLSKFASNRMVVVFPALELMQELNKQWTGIGLLSGEGVKSKYKVELDIATNDKTNEQLANAIEIAPLHVLISVGYLGLILHLLFYIILWLLVRKLKYSSLFGTILFSFFVLGLSGFAGWVGTQGLYLCGLALSAVILANYDALEEKNESKRRNNLFSGKGPHYNHKQIKLR